MTVPPRVDAQAAEKVLYFPVENGVCLWCGEGVLEKGGHITGERAPCKVILALAAELVSLKDALEGRDKLIDRLMETGVERWHSVVNDEPALFAWLGLTHGEYKAWFEDGIPAAAREALGRPA